MGRRWGSFFLNLILFSSSFTTVRGEVQDESPIPPIKQVEELSHRISADAILQAIKQCAKLYPSATEPFTPPVTVKQGKDGSCELSARSMCLDFLLSNIRELLTFRFGGDPTFSSLFIESKVNDYDGLKEKYLQTLPPKTQQLYRDEPKQNRLESKVKGYLYNRVIPSSHRFREVQKKFYNHQESIDVIKAGRGITFRKIKVFSFPDDGSSLPNYYDNFIFNTFDGTVQNERDKDQAYRNSVYSGLKGRDAVINFELVNKNFGNPEGAKMRLYTGGTRTSSKIYDRTTFQGQQRNSYLMASSDSEGDQGRSLAPFFQLDYKVRVRDSGQNVLSTYLPIVEFELRGGQFYVQKYEEEPNRESKYYPGEWLFDERPNFNLKKNALAPRDVFYLSQIPTNDTDDLRWGMVVGCEFANGSVFETHLLQRVEKMLYPYTDDTETQPAISILNTSNREEEISKIRAAMYKFDENNRKNFQKFVRNLFDDKKRGFWPSWSISLKNKANEIMKSLSGENASCQEVDKKVEEFRTIVKETLESLFQEYDQFYTDRPPAFYLRSDAIGLLQNSKIRAQWEGSEWYQENIPIENTQRYQVNSYKDVQSFFNRELDKFLKGYQPSKGVCDSKGIPECQMFAPYYKMGESILLNENLNLNLSQDLRPQATNFFSDNYFTTQVLTIFIQDIFTNKDFVINPPYATDKETNSCSEIREKIIGEFKMADDDLDVPSGHDTKFSRIPTDPGPGQNNEPLKNETPEANVQVSEGENEVDLEVGDDTNSPGVKKTTEEKVPGTAADTPLKGNEGPVVSLLPVTESNRKGLIDALNGLDEKEKAKAIEALPLPDQTQQDPFEDLGIEKLEALLSKLAQDPENESLIELLREKLESTPAPDQEVESRKDEREKGPAQTSLVGEIVPISKDIIPGWRDEVQKRLSRVPAISSAPTARKEEKEVKDEEQTLSVGNITPISKDIIPGWRDEVQARLSTTPALGKVQPPPLIPDKEDTDESFSYKFEQGPRDLLPEFSPEQKQRIWEAVPEGVRKQIEQNPSAKTVDEKLFFLTPQELETAMDQVSSHEEVPVPVARNPSPSDTFDHNASKNQLGPNCDEVKVEIMQRISSLVEQNPQVVSLLLVRRDLKLATLMSERNQANLEEDYYLLLKELEKVLASDEQSSSVSREILEIFSEHGIQDNKKALEKIRHILSDTEESFNYYKAGERLSADMLAELVYVLNLGSKNTSIGGVKFDELDSAVSWVEEKLLENASSRGELSRSLSRGNLRIARFLGEIKQGKGHGGFSAKEGRAYVDLMSRRVKHDLENLIKSIYEEDAPFLENITKCAETLGVDCSSVTGFNSFLVSSILKKWKAIVEDNSDFIYSLDESGLLNVTTNARHLLQLDMRYYHHEEHQEWYAPPPERAPTSSR